MDVSVRYSCCFCAIIDREVKVPARESEDVIEWMDNVCIVAIMRDHDAVSPSCRPPYLENIKIPVTGSDKIGGATLQ